MRADLAARHNAAVGTILGLAVGESLALTGEIPPVVCGQRTNFLAPWGVLTERAFAQAEASLRGHPLDIDLSPAHVAAVAIRLAATGVGPPLLADPDAAIMCEVIRDAMAAKLELAQLRTLDGPIGRAAAAAGDNDDFLTAVVSTIDDPEAAALTGAICGALRGPGSIPAAWTTDVRGPVGRNEYRPRQLSRLAERLLGADAPRPPEPRWRVGPREVAPKLWLSNLPGVLGFVKSHPAGAVISLCPTTGAFDAHPLRREFQIHDGSGRTVNPQLGEQVDEVLATIDAFHAEGLDVLVHCHHGASRTGLVLRAWLMREEDLNFDDVTAEAQVRWSKTSTWNHAFAGELKRRATT